MLLMSRIARVMAAVVFLGLSAVGTATAEEPREPLWYKTTAEGTPTVLLWFYWSESCPHCRKAKPFIQELERDLPWLDVRSMDVAKPVAVSMYSMTARLLGMRAGSVPAFFFCGQAEVGFGSAATTGETLRRKLVDCHEERLAGRPGPEAAVPGPIELPLFGPVNSGSFSLPVFTAVIAALDAFNPCAFFVLLFLLSLLVHSPNRLRMAVVGSIFVFASGALYFLFMAAWLNLFLIIGELRWVTAVAAVVAIGLAMVNLKDYARLGGRVSLSISDGSRTELACGG
jgi:thiol-disulfide isomerase/thioredoxin